MKLKKGGHRKLYIIALGQKSAYGNAKLDPKLGRGLLSVLHLTNDPMLHVEFVGHNFII